MLVLVMYDIATKSTEGKRRLRRMERICSNWGICVQESVYECEINAEQYRKLYKELETTICREKDNIRIYLLGNHFQNKCISIGKRKDEWDRQNFIL